MDEDVFEKDEVIEFYGPSGRLGSLKIKFIKSWILHHILYSNPSSNIIIQFQKMRGDKIGKGFV